MIGFLGQIVGGPPEYSSWLEYWRSAIGVIAALIGFYFFRGYGKGIPFGAFAAAAIAWALGGLQHASIVYWIPFGEGLWPSPLISLGLTFLVFCMSYTDAEKKIGIARRTLTLGFATFAGFLPYTLPTLIG